MCSPILLWEVGNRVFGSEDDTRNNLPVTRAHALGADESCSYSCRTCSAAYVSHSLLGDVACRAPLERSRQE